MKTVRVTITPAGIRAIYDDSLSGLVAAQGLTVTRVSHVEPTADGQWTADLSPVNGPTLGPFAKRQDALDAEVAWLHANLNV